MTKHKIEQIYEEASAGILRTQLAANMLPVVCETTLELFKKVEALNARIQKLERAHSTKYVPD